MRDRNTESIFTFELGKLKETAVKLDLEPNTTPEFVKARLVPFSLKGKVDQEFDQLLKAGMTETVRYDNMFNLQRTRSQNGLLMVL